MAFLMRRHGSLPTDAQQKSLIGHSLSVPTYAGNCTQSVSKYREARENTLPASTGISSKTLPPALCSFPNILPFPSVFCRSLSPPLKASFLISAFTALGCSNCWCIRMENFKGRNPSGANSAKTSAPTPWQWYRTGSLNSSLDQGQNLAGSFF